MKQHVFLKLVNIHCVIHVIYQDIQGQLRENIIFVLFSITDITSNSSTFFNHLNPP